MNYSALSVQLTRNLPKPAKKDCGIFFTPPSCVEANLALLTPYLSRAQSCLEPSCGSCEYVSAIHGKYPSLEITAIEYNKQIYDAILPLAGEKVNIVNADYLRYDSSARYDVIVGNPPYFVMKKGDVEAKYYPYFEGRPNIFVLFVAKSLTLLNDGGVLSFILPTSFLNSVYYNKMRQHIYQYYQILHIVSCDGHKYLETQQDTVMFLVQKPRVGEKPDNTVFSFMRNAGTGKGIGTGGGEAADILVFSPQDKIQKFIQLTAHSQTLYEMGFKVSVGNVVWNQHKDILTNDPTKTRLIYSSDIVDGELSMKVYGNDEKKNYIDKKGRRGAMLVINRGYGVGGYAFNYCLINPNYEYLVENHLICVEPATPNKMSVSELLDSYHRIIASFRDARTVDFIKNYFGNDAINTTEMNHILPIYRDVR